MSPKAVGRGLLDPASPLGDDPNSEAACSPATGLLTPATVAVTSFHHTVICDRTAASGHLMLSYVLACNREHNRTLPIPRLDC
jgi:hypothetical protein